MHGKKIEIIVKLEVIVKKSKEVMDNHVNLGNATKQENDIECKDVMLSGAEFLPKATHGNGPLLYLCRWEWKDKLSRELPWRV